MKPDQRIEQLLGALGVERAYVGGSNLTELEPLLARAPGRFAAVTLVNANRIAPAALSALGDRLTIVTGTSGLPASVVDAAEPELAEARIRRLPGYVTAAWSDMVADAPEIVLDAVCSHLDSSDVSALDPSDLPAEGEIEGISYTIAGRGPPLVLLPLLLSPSQWAPILASLAERFMVIQLGGAHLGMVAMLESRGGEPGYVRAVRSVFDEIAPTPGERILEIGCGSGVLARWIAAHTEGRNPILATDLNPFFLKEAAALSARAGLAGTIEFDEANAEALPFDDGTVDIAFSSTVMEECDAHKMLAEMVRVTKPGGRIGVIVRATDAHSVCGVETEPDIRAIIEAPYRSIGEGGVADARLYERFAASGLVGCSFFPHFLTLTNPEGAAWAYREPFFTGQFSEAQVARWAADKERAVERGTFVFASGLHCAVGTKVR